MEVPAQGGKEMESDEGQADQPADKTEDIWDEERLQSALDRLKEMYIQLRELRTSIPRLVAPLTVKQPSPEALFQKFAAAAITTNEEIRQFKDFIEDENSKKIFERANYSRTENPKGITPWRITEDADWLTRRT